MSKEWPSKTLGEVCQFRGGGTPSKAVDRYWRGDIPWVSPKDMKFEVVSDSIDHISQEAIDGSATSLVPKDSVLMVVRSGILARTVPIAITGRALTINQDLKALCPNGAVDVRFLYHLLDSKMEALLSMVSRGATVHRLVTDQIRSLDFILPPLTEQRRIVGILDEAVAGIAVAKANTEKNLQNARALFESHVQSVLTQRGTGWVDQTLDQVCIVERGSSPRPIKEFFTTKPEGVNWIKIGDTKEGGKYVYSTAQKITPQGAKQSRFVKEGDFILTNSMSFGRPYIMKTSGYIHDGWFVLRLNMSIDTDYFYYLLSSSFVQSQFAQLASGSVVKNISGNLVKKAVLPIAPLTQQHVIVEKLLEIAAKTQRLESLYQRRLVALDELKQSLLHRAFAGELTGQLRTSVVIPFPAPIPAITTTDLHAGVLAMAYELHLQKGKLDLFTHVKAEKIAHMIEARLGISLGRTPIKDAAGPNDFPHLRKVEHRARKANYFDFKQVEGAAYRVQKLGGFERLIERTRVALHDRCQDVEGLLQWMLPMNVRQAEIVATVFAAWNNLLLDGKKPTDDQIVFESRENWHPNKLKIERKKFLSAVQWLRRQRIVPEGKGMHVGNKAK
jgi:type I restriction enzyme, S subunit